MSAIITTENIGARLSELAAAEIAFAYLLGSTGTERFHSESDIDLAVFWKKVPAFSRIQEIQEALTMTFGVEVDLVSLNSIDLIFAWQVLETGRLLFCSESDLHLQWKMNQMSQYPDFMCSRSRFFPDPKHPVDRIEDVEAAFLSRAKK